MRNGFSPLLLIGSLLMVQLSGCSTTKASRAAKNTALINVEPEQKEAHVAHARMSFRRDDFRGALVALGDKIVGLEALFIAAESNFRLGRYADATRFYTRIVGETNDPIEKRKAHIRLFDIAIRARDTQTAIDRYVAFGKEYKKPSAGMRYSLGKALFDAGYFERAANVLRRVPKDNEFSMRARYIVAAMGVGTKKPEVLEKAFAQISEMAPISVEDYSVRELAILAQARILSEAKREVDAQKAYERVSLAGEFGETATIENIRMLLARANEARLAQGRFKRTSAFRKDLVVAEAIDKALKVVARYRNAHEIDWHKPELLTLMARLYVEAKRYDEARLAYQEMIGHFRGIHDELVAKNAPDAVWNYFALDFERDLMKPRTAPMIAGVPESLSKGVRGVDDILKLRDEIEASEFKLRLLEDRADDNQLEHNRSIAAARSRQIGMIKAYNEMVIKKQTRIRDAVANNINQALAEAEFKRAELVVVQMEDLKKQQSVVQDFQSEKIEAFESELKKLGDGDSL